MYAEVRFAPELHTQRGLVLPEIVEAVLAGFREGEQRAAEQGRNIRIGTLLSAMRTESHAREVAGLVVQFRDRGVVGFDIAGREAGFPPTRHLESFEYLRRENAHFTIHAGEAFGLPSIWEAIQWCGADRLGHGVRIIDDIRVDEDGTAHLGPLAAYIRDRRIPIGLLSKLRFRVTLNTDNQLMSDTSMTQDMAQVCEAFGWGWADLRWLTVNAMKSAFIPFDERLALINDVIKPAYAALESNG